MEKLFSIYKNLYNMFKKRKYIIPKEFELNYEEFCSKYENLRKTYVTMMKNQKNKTVIVFWNVEIKTENLQYYKNIADENDTKNIIVICSKVITPSVQSVIRHMKNLGYNVEIIEEDFLSIDVTNHVIVPEHTICTEKEKQDIEKNYGIVGMPEIKLTDPQVRYLGAKKGQIIKIKRHIDDILIKDIKKPIYEISYRIVS